MTSSLPIETVLAPEGMLPLRVAPQTPNRIETADGWAISIQWFNNSLENPAERAEQAAAFIVATVNAPSAPSAVPAVEVVGLEWGNTSADAPRDGTWFIAATSDLCEIRVVHFADSSDRLPIDHSGKAWSALPVKFLPLSGISSLATRIQASLVPAAPADQSDRQTIMSIVEAVDPATDENGVWTGSVLEAVLAVQNERDALRVELGNMELRKDEAYEERNKVVAALAKLFPSGICKTDIPGWSAEWHGCVRVDLPTGQVSWHYHDSQAYLFEGLPAYQGEWDGHDTPEKYRRLAALSAAPAETVPGSGERERLVEALRKAAEDFHTIQTLNSHGASDLTYISWLRANAAEAERRVRDALSSGAGR